MSRLYFENSREERRLIGEPSDDQECWRMIRDFCTERNFIIPYVRIWVTPEDEKYYDVSSHTEFFVEVNDNNDTTRES